MGLALAFAVVALALVLRLLRHSTNYELFVDEITYTNIGVAISSGKGALLYGQPFFLHPPAFFYLLAGVMDLFGRAGTTLTLVLHLRVVNAALGTIDVALMMLLLRRLAGVRWALCAGLFMALDPFLLLFDGRVLLETMATTSTTAGMLVLIALSDRLQPREGRGPASSRIAHSGSTGLALGAGILFAVALLTKETYCFVGLVPMVILLLTGRFLPRRWSALVVATTTVCYLGYMATVFLDGRATTWWHQQESGLLRAAGSKQITGFNQAGHVSAVSRFVATAPENAATYVFVAATAVALLWRAWRWWRSRRPAYEVTVDDLMTLWGGCAALYVAFSVLRGAFEQQIFYPFLVTALPATVLSIKSWAGSAAQRSSPRALAASLGIIGLVLAYDAAVDVRLRFSTDAAYTSLTRWLAHHHRPTDVVDATDGVSQFILRGVRLGTANSLSAVLRYRPDDVVVATSLVKQGYVHLNGGLGPYLARHGTVLYRAHGRSLGSLILYRLHWPAPGRAPTSGG